MPTPFCSNCGVRQPPADQGGPSGAFRCSSCGNFHNNGPQLLTLVAVYAEDMLLMIRRGVEPYRGKWAPPGGYVEKGESVEAAGSREVFEETGLLIEPSNLLAHGVISITALNQVHICLMAMLEKAAPLRPGAPEALDAQWFPMEAYPSEEVWDPFLSISVAAVYHPCRTQRLPLLQQTDNARRVVFTDVGFSHPWEKI